MCVCVCVLGFRWWFDSILNSIVVTNDLTATWRQAICDQYNAIDVYINISSPPPHLKKNKLN